MERTLMNIRVDELPLLQHIMSDLGIIRSIDSVLPVHGNWSGVSIGTITSYWLCYILSTCDHRLQNVEDWSENHLPVLQILSGEKSMSSLDFSDDKLGSLLEKLGNSDAWCGIEGLISKNCLSVYRFEEMGSLATFRLDAAPMQSHGEVKEGGLLQYGHHKQHADLGQFKVKLCTLDNELNHFAYPVTHLTVSGNKSDDALYIPIMEQNKAVLRGISGYEKGNLYVGDSKFGAISSRAYVSQGEDYYLMPLSLVQLSVAARQALIQKSDPSSYSSVFREVGDNKEIIGQGFEVIEQLTYTLDDVLLSWTERRLFVHGTAYAKSQQHAFDNRLTKIITQLEDLTTRKQGKAHLTTVQAVQEAVDKLLKDNNLVDFLVVNIQTTESSKTLRAYGSKPARTEITRTFTLEITKNEANIATHKSLLGWQVYATNASKVLLPFEKCVLKYRHQSNIESSFDDLRNKVAHLVPIYLQKEERIKGLVNLLLLALKVCAVLEYKMAAALSKNDEQLCQIYEGNPKRGSKRPSVKRICKAFDGVSIALIFVNYKLQFAIMTNLEPVQSKILKLLDIEKEVYTELAHKIQIFFSENFFSET